MTRRFWREGRITYGEMYLYLWGLDDVNNNKGISGAAMKATSTESDDFVKKIRKLIIGQVRIGEFFTFAFIVIVFIITVTKW